jgi:hypothetical protein
MAIVGNKLYIVYESTSTIYRGEVTYPRDYVDVAATTAITGLH